MTLDLRGVPFIQTDPPPPPAIPCQSDVVTPRDSIALRPKEWSLVGTRRNSTPVVLIVTDLDKCDTFLERDKEKEPKKKKSVDVRKRQTTKRKKKKKKETDKVRDSHVTSFCCCCCCFF